MEAAGQHYSLLVLPSATGDPTMKSSELCRFKRKKQFKCLHDSGGLLVIQSFCGGVMMHCCEYD